MKGEIQHCSSDLIFSRENHCPLISLPVFCLVYAALAHLLPYGTPLNLGWHGGSGQGREPG
jgi:hypothetical protein